MPLPAGLADFAPHELEALASALGSGRLAPPFTALKLRAAGLHDAAGAANALGELATCGMTVPSLALLLEAIAAERRRGVEGRDCVELVVTGPDVGATARDTGVVTRELFREARRHVLVVGFAVYQGREIFRTLAERLDAAPELEAVLCFDIARAAGDTSIDADVVARFAKRFAEKEWPGRRLPAVFYDPRSLARTREKRTSLHAKCVVVDRAKALVTSANFTEAAHERNIELGLIVRSRQVAGDIAAHFEALIAKGLLVRVAFGAAPQRAEFGGR